MSFIYLAVYADNTCYVGQTRKTFKQLEARYQRYAKKQRSRRPSEQACFALGMPALGVIEYCPPEKLDERERYWIAMHRQDSRCLNITDGGVISLARYEDEQAEEARLATMTKARAQADKLLKQARRGR